ncbi:transporter substrate-binding protein [Defluviimonas sp. SAOS-178_SWC]|uniref:transporter substrate-binding protein n=1 Tax=Defluviimonas sp. SAOS-178_SWC TaxID=3121287 RepID=UPI003221A426
MLASGAAALVAPRMAFAQKETIKIGVLNSLSGTTATSETTLKDTMLMLIGQQNAKDGVLGKKREAVVVDPASDWPLFAEKARELLTVDKGAVLFCCRISVSRKSVLPDIEELNGLLFHPVQYEGEESSKNVFYPGAAPNQQAIPAVDCFLEELGVEKFALLGTDYVYPRTTNNILDAYPRHDRRVPDEIYDLFLMLKEMTRRRGGDLSGGQQQLAIARAMIMRPKVLLLDEPTEGTQPNIIQEIGHVISHIKARGNVAIVLVEQHFDFAWTLADRAYVFDRGTVAISGRMEDLSVDTVREQFYI